MDEIAIGTQQPDYLDALCTIERRVGMPLKWLLFLVGMIFAWGMGRPRSSFLALLSILLYGMSNVLLSYLLYTNVRLALPVSRGAFMLSFIADLCFSSVLIHFTGGVGSDLYILYCLLALKAILFYPLWRAILIPLYGIGPLYVFLLYYNSGNFFFLADRQFLFRYILLFAVILGATYLGWLVEREQGALARLSSSLSQTRQELESKTELIQRTAQDLGNRVVELRSLQEGVKAISSALALESVLQLIVTNASKK